ncbi:redoxin domain-containing protein [Lacibacter luteus]|uniref:Redoxin domain-containing protein n=1 Tax=Lacibacter luteus TaxID=2508719 RepID=A0A4Q1CKP6_9BACT|nr:redoxin family protein [Lacibacter luteus]RXK61537.1 redoxin domain-containing protein [Lacibacter luteus]
MKKILFSAVIVMAAFAFTALPEELTIGSSIPNANKKMKDISGKEYSFSDVKKKNGLLVVFSCNTCPWVIKNQQVAAEGYGYALGKEVGVIVLNSNEASRGDGDSQEKMKEYAKAQGYKYPYVMDDNSTMADAFGARVTPECYLFDKDMKLVYHGAITDNPKTPSESTRDHLKVAIDEIVGGKDVSMKTSKAMGCGIKRKS